MINDLDSSSIRIRLEELYDLADKRLGEAKENMIMNDIEYLQITATFILDKIRLLKSMIVKGTKFDTALVYRILQLSPESNVRLPDCCGSCDYGYITDNEDTSYACSCDLGKHRHRTEKVAYYKELKPLSINMQIQRGLYKLTDKENIIYNTLKEHGISRTIKKVLCPF